MAITNGYCTLAEIRRRMGKNDNDTGNDTLLEEAIEDASRQIDFAIHGRNDVITYSAVTLTTSQVRSGLGMNAEGLIMDWSRKRIYFPSKINTITAVTDDEEALTVNVDYYIGYDFIEADGSFTSDKENGVKITGTIGSDTIPNDIRELCLQMAMVYSGISTKIITDTGGTVIEQQFVFPDMVNKKLKKLNRKLF